MLHSGLCSKDRKMSEHIFISYSHKDSSIADRIANALNRAEIPIFIDKIALQPGDSLTSRIGQALEDAKALIVLISESSVSSKWVLNEITTVKEQGTLIIPFRCDKTSWPAKLRLLLGDPLYLDGAEDFNYAVGLVPKLFPKINALEQIGVKFRQENKNEDFRRHLSSYLDQLSEAQLEDIDRVAAEVTRGIASLFVQHNQEAKRIEEEYRRKHTHTLGFIMLTAGASMYPWIAPFLGLSAALAPMGKLAFDLYEEYYANRKLNRSLAGVLSQASK